MFVLDVVDKVFSSGEKVELVITTPSIAAGTAVLKKLREMKDKGLPIEIYYGLPQKEYYKIASECHLFLSAIEETETANSIFEQLYLGQVGIFPKVNWVNEFLPDYPYQYKGIDEAYMQIKDFIKNPQKRIEDMNKYREIIDLS